MIYIYIYIYLRSVLSWWFFKLNIVISSGSNNLIFHCLYILHLNAYKLCFEFKWLPCKHLINMEYIRHFILFKSPCVQWENKFTDDYFFFPIFISSIYFHFPTCLECLLRCIYFLENSLLDLHTWGWDACNHFRWCPGNKLKCDFEK